MSEKVQGKRAAADEPAQKKRKTAGAAPLKPGSISDVDAECHDVRVVGRR